MVCFGVGSILKYISRGSSSRMPSCGLAVYIFIDSETRTDAWKYTLYTQSLRTHPTFTFRWRLLLWTISHSQLPLRGTRVIKQRCGCAAGRITVMLLRKKLWVYPNLNFNPTKFNFEFLYTKHVCRGCSTSREKRTSKRSISIVLSIQNWVLSIQE